MNPNGGDSVGRGSGHRGSIGDRSKSRAHELLGALFSIRGCSTVARRGMGAVLRRPEDDVLRVVPEAELKKPQRGRPRTRLAPDRDH